MIKNRGAWWNCVWKALVEATPPDHNITLKEVTDLSKALRKQICAAIKRNEPLFVKGKSMLRLTYHKGEKGITEADHD